MHSVFIPPCCQFHAHQSIQRHKHEFVGFFCLLNSGILSRTIRQRSFACKNDMNGIAQAPFIVPALLASGNALVAELVARIEAALPDIPSSATLAGDLCISERTLARRIQAATGNSPSALIQFVRLKRARLLLETSQMSVDRIAELVGYRDATALRRLMHKAFAATPRQFRKRAI